LFISKITRDTEAGGWEIVLSTGEALTTTSKVVAARAQSCHQYRQPIQVAHADGVISDLRTDGPAADDVTPV
jgi:hypothetical protein